jgi:hypothetical protein
MGKDIKALIKGSKLPTRSVPICLRGDLVAEHERLSRELDDAVKNRGRKLSDGGDARRLAERIRQLELAMAEATVDFELRSLGRRWKRFLAEHPPRRAEDGTVDERDKAIGVNVETFFTDLIRASVVSPVLDEEDWAALLGDPDDPDAEGGLSDAQVDELGSAAWALNRGGVDVPFSHAASRILSSEPE